MDRYNNAVGVSSDNSNKTIPNSFKGVQLLDSFVYWLAVLFNLSIVD